MEKQQVVLLRGVMCLKISCPVTSWGLCWLPSNLNVMIGLQCTTVAAEKTPTRSTNQSCCKLEMVCYCNWEQNFAPWFLSSSKVYTEPNTELIKMAGYLTRLLYKLSFCLPLAADNQILCSVIRCYWPKYTLRVISDFCAFDFLQNKQIFTSTKEVMFLVHLIGLSVCLTISRIVEKLLARFIGNLVEGYSMGQGRITFWVQIRITAWKQWKHFSLSLTVRDMALAG